MKTLGVSLLLASITLLPGAGWAGEIHFQDPFKERLQPGWTWVREKPGSWRITEHGLEIRTEPGNMWGPANDARNVLRRALPDPTKQPVEISVTAENRPTEQYEQVDLVWQYDDGHQVKIGQEKVDGKLTIVMGREEKDRTRTLAIIPLDTFSVRLRLTAHGNQIKGEFRKAGSEEWVKAGECDLPVNGDPFITIQCYQGPAETEHWARLNDFQIRLLEP